MESPLNQKLLASSLALGFGLLIAGCGGGSSSTPVVVKAEGVYAGTLTGSNSRAFRVIVLENDEYWGLYGSDVGSTFLISGFIQGQGASTGTAFTSSNAKDFGFNPAASGTVSGTYAAGVSFSGTAAFAAGSATFTGAPIPTASLVYASPATIATVAGNWSLTTLAGAPVTLSIAASGSFTGSTQGCNFSGTLTPRASGKNVFNSSVTFGGAPCALAGQTGTGIGISYLTNTGTRQLVLAGTDVGRTTGTVLFGTR
jgi:hypothetical protein